MAEKSDNKSSAGWRFDNSFIRLPGSLYSRVEPVPVARPALAVLNHALASELGLDAGVLRVADAGVFAGNQIPQGAEPIAQAYAGHQFGHFTNLGDGRAILLGEQIAPSGARFDIQLKGAGRTPYSRAGDGRAALGPMLREYIISEAMHALGIPTTRSLAVATTGEQIVRDQFLPGAVLTRVASSHIRVGTFEYAAATGDSAALRALTEYTLQRHYSGLAGAENSALALLEAVLEGQAALVAQWLGVGFIHGVMNTDNMALSGETIDYGPCAFMDAYDPSTVFSSIDRGGRYAYGNQPAIVHWNLARLAEALLPLIDRDEDKAAAAAAEALEKFPGRFRAHYLSRLGAKFGLLAPVENDFALAEEFLGEMQKTKADFTVSFDVLTRIVERGTGEALPPFDSPSLPAWCAKWEARLCRQQKSKSEVAAVMRRANPVVIPRNHRVEQALDAAAVGDFSVMRRLLEVLAKPFEETQANEPYRAPAGSGGESYRTFCGT